MPWAGAEKGHETRREMGWLIGGLAGRILPQR